MVCEAKSPNKGYMFPYLHVQTTCPSLATWARFQNWLPKRPNYTSIIFVSNCLRLTVSRHHPRVMLVTSISIHFLLFFYSSFPSSICLFRLSSIQSHQPSFFAINTISLPIVTMSNKRITTKLKNGLTVFRFKPSLDT